MPALRTGAPAIETKLAKIKRYLAAGEDIEALRIAARFGQLGAHKERITRAWAAFQNPEMYRAMGMEPDALVADGIAAIRERYGLGD